MKNKTALYKSAALAALLTANQFMLPAFAEEPETPVITDQADQADDETTNPDQPDASSDETAPEETETAEPDNTPVQDQEPPAANESGNQTSKPVSEGSAVLNGTTYSNIQEAINAIGENGTGTITVNGAHHSPAVIAKGQKVTIEIAQGASWDNKDASVTGKDASVLTNNGTLILKNKGTMTAFNQGAAVLNKAGASAKFEGGLYTADSGETEAENVKNDAILINEGEMELKDLKVEKKKAGVNPYAITNGLTEEKPSKDAPTAKMTLEKVTAEASAEKGIALNNDKKGEMTIVSGTYTGKAAVIRNVNQLEIQGGSFTVREKGGAAIINAPLSGDQKDFGTGQVTIKGGDFYADDASDAVISQTAASGAENAVQISGGSFWADQPEVKNNLVKPCTLVKSQDGRWVVEVPVSSIDLNAATTTVTVDESLTIQAQINPDNATRPEVAWSVDNPELAEIEPVETEEKNRPEAVLKALKPGTVIVTAEADGVKQEIEIVIREKMTLSITPESASLYAGETTELKAEIEPEEYEDAEITWTSSDPEVAEVDENGTVKAIKPGKATITAKAEEKASDAKDKEASDGQPALQSATAEAEIEVKEGSITLDPSEFTLKKGSTKKLKAVIEPEEFKDEELKWSSSDKKIATVTSKGTVKGVKAGEAEITVSLKNYPEIKATAKVTVVNKTSSSGSSSSSKTTTKKSGSSKTAAVFGTTGLISLAAASAAGMFFISKKKKK